MEVVPERKPPALELAALRDAVHTLAKAKIIDISTISDAWQILDMDYGNPHEVRTKLKDQVISIKLKAAGDSRRIV